MTVNSDGGGTASSDGFPDAETVIESFGGIRPAAAKLGVPVTTVQGWKNRGRIPENRHASIREIAARLGVELGAAGPTSTAPEAEGTGNAEAATASDAESAQTAGGMAGPAASSAASAGAERGPTWSTAPNAPDPEAEHEADAIPAKPRLPNIAGWLALAVAFIALGVALFALRPEIAGKLSGSGTAGLQERMDQIDTTIGGKVSALAKRTEQLAQAQGTISTDLAGQQARSSELEQGIAALTGRLEAELSSVSGKLDALRKRVDTAAGEAESVSKDVVAGLRNDVERLEAALAAIHKTQASLGESVSRIAAEQARAAGSRFALLLGVGQLETEVRSGEAYRGALERLRYIASNRTEFEELLMRLEAHASEGIPTAAELERRLEALRPELVAGPTPPGGRDFLDAVWARVKSTVSLRRIDAESRSPATLAERAIRSGDLDAALAATEGYGGDVARWREDVRTKLASEAALQELHERTLDHVKRDVSDGSKIDGTENR